MKFTIVCIVIGVCLEHVSQGAPVVNVTSDSLPIPPKRKARCMSSLFGGLFDFDSPTLPDIPSVDSFGGGLQGGMLSPGLGSSGGFGTGLGVPSRYTPGLGQASGAMQNAYGLESQMYGAQAQLNSQLAGVPGSGIPLSSGLFRAGDASQLSFQPPPTILRSPYDASIY